jgi:hypothetical protein
MYDVCRAQSDKLPGVYMQIALFEFPSYNSKEPSKYMTILIQIEMMLYVSYISIEGL